MQGCCKQALTYTVCLQKHKHAHTHTMNLLNYCNTKGAMAAQRLMAWNFMCRASKISKRDMPTGMMS